MTAFNQDEDDIKLFKELRKESMSAWSAYHKEANKDFKFYLGDQWNSAEKSWLASQNRNALVFNRIRRNVKMVTGYERRTRHSLIASAVENSDEDTADILTAAMLWSSNRDDMERTRSDAFESALVTGCNMLKFSLDTSRDPDGDIVLDRFGYNEFLIDPHIKRRDLEDCQYILERKTLARDQIMSRLPKYADEIATLQARESETYMGGKKIRGSNFLTWDEVWIRTTEKTLILVDSELGTKEIIDPNLHDMERIKKWVEVTPSSKLITTYMPSVKQIIFVEGIPMHREDDPLKIRDFPHVPLFIFWHPEYEEMSHDIRGLPGREDYGDFFRSGSYGNHALKLQGLVRCMRDPQIEVNKSRSQILDWMQTRLNSGWKAKKSSVVNVDDLYQSGQGKVIYMDDHAPMSDVEPLISPDLPPSFFQMKEMMDRDLLEIPGINDELMGVPQDGVGQMSGTLAKLRQAAGLTTLQDVFDNFGLTMKILGKKHLKIMMANWPLKKFERITNKKVTEDIKNRASEKYDVTIEESMETSTQKALVFAQIMQAKQLGFDIPDKFAIDYMMMQNKSELRDELQRIEQLKAQHAQLEMEDRKRLNELQRAKVFSDVGLGVERMARSEADRGLARERISEMQENQAQAQLARIKAIKEIEAMDTDRLIRLVEFTKGMEERQIMEGEQIAQQQEEKADQQLGLVSDFVFREEVPGNERT